MDKHSEKILRLQELLYTYKCLIEFCTRTLKQPNLPSHYIAGYKGLRHKTELKLLSYLRALSTLSDEEYQTVLDINSFNHHEIDQKYKQLERIYIASNDGELPPLIRGAGIQAANWQINSANSVLITRGSKISEIERHKIKNHIALLQKLQQQEIQETKMHHYGKPIGTILDDNALTDLKKLFPTKKPDD